MHKVILEAPTEKTLDKVHRRLVDAEIKHKLWVEQPEGIATAIATKPYPKSVVAALFKGLRLLR